MRGKRSCLAYLRRWTLVLVYPPARLHPNVGPCGRDGQLLENSVTKNNPSSKGVCIIMRRVLFCVFSEAVVAFGMSSIGVAELVTIQPGPSDGKDSFVDNRAARAGTNYGSAGYVRVGQPDGGTGLQRIMAQFDVSSAPAADQVLSVKFEAYLYDGSAQAAASVGAHRITADWSESTVTWNNQPAFDTSAADTIMLPMLWEHPENKGHWYSWDITDTYKDWKDGVSQNYGVMLSLGSPIIEGYSFYSSETTADPGLRPRLVVTAVPEPSLLVLLGSGMLGLLAYAWRRRK